MGNQTLLHLPPSPNGLSTWGSDATCSQPFSRPLNVWIQLVFRFFPPYSKSLEVTPEWKKLIFKLSFIGALPSFHKPYNFFLNIKQMLSRRNSFHRHPHHSTYRSHLHHHSFSHPLSGHWRCHPQVHTYRSNHKEKRTHHTAFRSVLYKQDKKKKNFYSSQHSTSYLSTLSVYDRRKAKWEA